MRTCVELGHALGNQHWPALIKGDHVYVPLTVDRKVMASVMNTHRFEDIRYEFVPGSEVVPYLAPHESRRLFGGAEGPVHSHTHETYAEIDAETGHVYGRPPARIQSRHPATTFISMDRRLDPVSDDNTKGMIAPASRGRRRLSRGCCSSGTQCSRSGGFRFRAAWNPRSKRASSRIAATLRPSHAPRWNRRRVVTASR